MNILYISLAFLSGSLPLSVWLGRLRRVEIREYGDGNPGAANVWRSSGPFWGAAAVLLDFAKGLLPVALANYLLEIRGWPLVAVALAPVLGHAFSPFLRFQGGKALAVTFGIWTGLTLYIVPPVLGLFFGLGLWLLAVEGWAVLTGMIALALLFPLLGAEAAWWWVWSGNLAVLLWKHRHDLTQKPHLRILGKLG